MIIYNKTGLDNFSVGKAAAAWFKRGLISNDEYKGIEAKYITEYKPRGIGAWIGLFIFTVIIVSSASGLFFLFFHPDGETGIAFECLVLGVLCYIVAERFVWVSHHYKSGIVDALLYNALVAVGIAICIFINKRSTGYNDDGTCYYSEHGTAFYLAFLTPMVVAAALRFADAFLTLVAYGFIIVINAFVVLKMGSFGQMILPFECMLFSAAVYYTAKKRKANIALRYWRHCLGMLEFAGLVTLYLAGNYMVVRVLSESLLGTTIEPGEDIHLAFFFYAYTILVPLAYVALGLKRKDRMLVRLGVIMIAAGVLSIKYYHSIMPPETALMLSGIALVAVAWLSIRYLKVPRNGITSEPDDANARMDAISNIAFSELVQQAPAKPANDVNFGGGSFGGGGATSDY